MTNSPKNIGTSVPMPPVMGGLDILKTNENYKGRSYGELSCEWSNWLMSDAPDNYNGGDILFLRGNMEHYGDIGSILDRTEGYYISTHTAIFIPIITAEYHLEDFYEGSRLSDEEGIRHAVRSDLDGGGKLWGFIKKVPFEHVSKLESVIPETKDMTTDFLINWDMVDRYRIVKDLREFRVESHLYEMRVSPSSPLRRYHEGAAIEAETYASIVGGYFVLIKPPLEKGAYRIRFGGMGKGNYRTDAVYDIKVQEVHRQPEVGRKQVVPPKNEYGI